MLIGVAGGALGFLEKRGTLPISVANMPTKLMLGIAGSLVEANTSGASRRIAGAIADTSLAIYGYQAAKTGALIAGEVVGEDDEL